MRKTSLASKATVAILAVGFLVSIPVTWAYAPPAAFIVKTSASKHNTGKGVLIRANLKIEDLPSLKITHLYHADRGILRTTVLDEAGQVIYRHQKALTTHSVSLDVPVDAIGALLLDSRSRQIIQFLRRKGMLAAEEGKESEAPSPFLARWNKTVAWVLSPLPTDSTEKVNRSQGPQLWIEKDTFLPLRWKGQLEVEFQNYRPYKDFFYPRLMSVFTSSSVSTLDDKKILLKEEVTDLRVNPPELAELEKPSARVDSLGEFTSSAESLSSSMRSAIQRYFNEAQ